MGGPSGQTVAAVDLGAESGRVVAATFDGEQLRTQVQGRFPNAPRAVGGILRWDTETIWRHVCGRLAQLAASVPVTSVGVDTWGVDYVLLRADGGLVDQPTCYRDPRGLAAMQQAIAAVGVDALYAATGTQVMEINTVFALLSDTMTSTRLADAQVLLMMPDLFHHLLSGSRVSEHTIASTSGAYDTASGAWATGLLQALDIPTHVLPEVVQPGTRLGPVVGELARLGLGRTQVVAPASHDTASAVAATPFVDRGALFISSGTWSLVGTEQDRPVLTPAALAANLTNEGGPAGTTLLLRNVMGLWLLQECRRQWSVEGQDLTYADLAALAAREPALRTVVNPNAPEFLAPGDMPARIRAYCERHGEPVPETVGAIARCVVDSLALGYRSVAADLVAVTGRRPPSISITGGGSQHALLAQATADATGLPVHCGPVEATALGNAGVQLIAAGALTDVADLRRVVAASCDLRTFQPCPGAGWDEAADRLRRLARADDRARGLR